MYNILELAKKLKALADKGVGGEAVNAAKKLELICLKHGINLEDLDDDKLQMGWFNVKPQQRKFFIQVVASVLGSDFSTYSQLKNGKKIKDVLGIESKPAQIAEVEMKYTFYWRAYQEELAIFYRAFIQTNQLYVKGSSAQKDLTPEEEEMLERTLAMAQAMRKHEFRKQLNSSHVHFQKTT